LTLNVFGVSMVSVGVVYWKCCSESEAGGVLIIIHVCSVLDRTLVLQEQMSASDASLEPLILPYGVERVFTLHAVKRSDVDVTFPATARQRFFFQGLNRLLFSLLFAFHPTNSRKHFVLNVLMFNCK
jgi:hypothetical protein